MVAPWATMGSNVTIQHGVTIGNDVAVGANAVVNADAPDRAVVVGVAAKVVNYEGSFDIVLYAGMDTDPARLASLANTPRAGSL